MTRKEAAALRQKLYVGAPCLRGHDGRRYTSSGKCMACNPLLARKNYSLEKQRAYHLRVPEIRRSYKRLRYKENPEYFRELERQRRLKNADHVNALDRARNQTPARKAQRKFQSWMRTHRVRQATPRWVDHNEMRRIFVARPPGMTIDHIIPIKGFSEDGYPVSGLHVPWNLQYLTDRENKRKANRGATWEQLLKRK